LSPAQISFRHLFTQIMVASHCLIAGVGTLVGLTLHGCDSNTTTTTTPASEPAFPTFTCPSQPPASLEAPVGSHGAGPMAKARAFGRWIRRARAEPENLRELVFLVRQRNLGQVHELLRERSSPQSPDYGKWLGASELRELTRNDVALHVLREALQRAGADILRVTKGGEMMRARAPHRVWQELLSAEFHTYTSQRYNSSHVAAESYSIPEDLREHISGVLGCTDLPTMSQLRVSSALQVNQAGKLVPDAIRQAYKMPPMAEAGSQEAKNRQSVSQAVYASLNQFWSPSDRKQFQQQYGLYEQPVEELDSGNQSSDLACLVDANNCLEANLDVQYMGAMSPWSQMGLWYTDGADFLSFLEDLMQRDEPPEVISISYGGFEAVQSPEQIQAFDTAAQKLGLMGVTLVVASGDDGAQGGLWKDKDSMCADTEKFGLQVSWPASSQYVTAVGATAGVESGEAERTCQILCTDTDMNWCMPDPKGPLITSGGGMSGVTPTPSWQVGQNLCEKRGIPDVSLAGHSYNIIVGGKQQAVDGTSASAPVFGGMVSLVNARRKAAGKSTVGFVNPAMYQNPSAFNDITKGDNKCGGAGSQDRTSGTIPCCGGYDAQVGWDAATGLGSVNFPKFEAIFEPAAAVAV